eukprot:scaffold268311_cov40-Tisochrysis_lutea.AAC.3
MPGERNYRYFLLFLWYHSVLCFYAAYLHCQILAHMSWDVYRLHEAYYLGTAPEWGWKARAALLLALPLLLVSCSLQLPRARGRLMNYSATGDATALTSLIAAALCTQIAQANTCE